MRSTKWSESERKALDWLARAVPVPVHFWGFDSAGCFGQYNQIYDRILIRAPGDPSYVLFGSRANVFLGTLAHEAIHTTGVKHRLNRLSFTTAPAAVVAENEVIRHLLTSLEEHIARQGTVALAKLLGFAHAGYVPPDTQVGPHAQEAVDWLATRAKRIVKRPFRDDLAMLTHHANLRGRQVSAG